MPFSEFEMFDLFVAGLQHSKTVELKTDFFTAKIASRSWQLFSSHCTLQGSCLLSKNYNSITLSREFCFSFYGHTFSHNCEYWNLIEIMENPIDLQ